MANNAATHTDNPQVDQGHLPYSLQRYRYLIVEKIRVFPLISLLIMTVICWALSPWHAEDYSVTRSIEAMGNSTCHYFRYNNGSNGLYHSMSVFESSSVSLVSWSQVLHVAIELEAESELPNGNVISKMWHEMLDGVTLVMDSSQELNTRGKWGLYVLFVEYKVLSRDKKSKGVDYENLLSKIVKMLHISEAQLEELEVSISSARRSTASAQLSLHSTKKQLQLHSEKRGLGRWLVSHFRGDRAFLRRQTGLNLTRIAIERASEVSEYLSGMDTRVKSYKDNIIAVHNSIKIEQAEGCQKSRISFCLVFLESILSNLY
ncbi:hypothetical protein PSHT_12573 [Puccinia striiformis]|uniref:Uncharacterized protein n=1 Tax=Puccinia striiformis TaxID=27350 RepID=A0A2S4UVP6_9BASI|nr:hypothetical protein PSHT_12573 [Puccinia striiformis]